MTAPITICRQNVTPTLTKPAALTVPAASRLDIKAMPTGSFAPDSPSRMVPLRPAISRRPNTENTTAGSVGATAVATSAARYQSMLNAACSRAAAPAAVRKVPTTPVDTMGPAAARNRDQPMCMPPSNNTNTKATVMIRSTRRSGGACSAGSVLAAMAPPASTKSGVGILSRSVRRFAMSATSPTALTQRMITA